MSIIVLLFYYYKEYYSACYNMVLLRDYAIQDTWFIDITGKERLSGSQSLSNLLYLKIRAGPSTP